MSIKINRLEEGHNSLRQISGGILEKPQKVIQEQAVVCWNTKEMYILYKLH
jgi:hypothetical protein